MTQRYSNPTALERMAAGTCPECGRPPESHIDDVSLSFLVGISGGCNILPHGVEDRIAQYRADVEVQS